jgi:uncharacterized RDD family membrane protein YckC
MTHLLLARPALVAVLAALVVALTADRAAAQSYLRPTVRIGQDLTLPESAEVRHALVIAGSATIDGRVAGDLLVYLGDARLGSTAIVEGSVVVVAGSLTVSPGAMVEDDVVVAGGTLSAPPDAAPGRQQIVIGFPEFGHALRELVPWIMRGFLWGRPIVPDLPWVWTVVAIVFFVSFTLNLLFDGLTRAAAGAVARRPINSLFTGLLVLLAAGPILLLVAATVVGLVVVPIVLCAGFAAWTIGKVGVARGVGQRIWPQDDEEGRLQGVRSFLLGFVAIALAYMVPVLGIVTWSLVAVIGLGAATSALVGALRRESPPRVPAPEPPPLVPPSALSAEVQAPDEFAQPASAAADIPLVREPGGSGEGPSAARGAQAFPYARFLDRAAAFALDCVLVAIAAALLDWMEEPGPFFALLLGYHIAFWAWQGTTLGGIVVGLRVVRTDGTPPRAVDALVRGLASLLSFAAIGIGLFWMIQDAERQTWHDKIAGTYVVKVPRAYPLR